MPPRCQVPSSRTSTSWSRSRRKRSAVAWSGPKSATTSPSPVITRSCSSTWAARTTACAGGGVSAWAGPPSSAHPSSAPSRSPSPALNLPRSGAPSSATHRAAPLAWADFTGSRPAPAPRRPGRWTRRPPPDPPLAGQGQRLLHRAGRQYRQADAHQGSRQLAGRHGALVCAVRGDHPVENAFQRHDDAPHILVPGYAQQQGARPVMRQSPQVVGQGLGPARIVGRVQEQVRRHPFQTPGVTGGRQGLAGQLGVQQLRIEHSGGQSQRHAGVVMLVLARQAQCDVPDRLFAHGEVHVAVSIVAHPVGLARRENRCTARRRHGSHHPHGRRDQGPDDQWHVRLDDTGLFGGDTGQIGPQVGGVVDADMHDCRGDGLHDVGGVQPSPHADLDHGHIDSGPGQVQETSRGGQLEIGEQGPVLDPRPLGNGELLPRVGQFGQQRVQLGIRDGSALHADPLVDLLQVGRGQLSGAQAVGHEDLAAHPDHTALAVGARDVQDRYRRVRRSQDAQERAHAIQTHAHAVSGSLRQEGVVEHGGASGGTGKHGQDPDQRLPQLGAGNDAVDEAMLQQVLAGLETGGKGLADGLLDDPLASKTNERLGLSQDEVAQHREAGRNAAGGRVGQDADVGLVRLVPQPRQGSRGLGHLHEREHALLHPRAARGADDDHRLAQGDAPLDLPGDQLAGHRAHGPTHEGEVERADLHRTPVDGGTACQVCIGFAGLGLGRFQPCGVGLAVDEIQGVEGSQLGIMTDEAVRVDQTCQPLRSRQAQVVPASAADLLAVFQVLLVQHGLARRTLGPELGDLGLLHAGARARRGWRLLEPAGPIGHGDPGEGGRPGRGRRDCSPTRDAAPGGGGHRTAVTRAGSDTAGMPRGPPGGRCVRILIRPPTCPVRRALPPRHREAPAATPGRRGSSAPAQRPARCRPQPWDARGSCRGPRRCPGGAQATSWSP